MPLFLYLSISFVFMEKTTISDAQLKDELLKLFESGNTAKTNLYELLRTKYKLEKQRCLKTFDIVYKEWSEIKAKAQDVQIQANAKEGLKSGLKSKIERMLDLQSILELGTYEETIIDSKTLKEVTYIRKLKPLEIKALHAELSLMGGDYAPAKQDIVIQKIGKDLEDELYVE